MIGGRNHANNSCQYPQGISTPCCFAGSRRDWCRAVGSQHSTEESSSNHPLSKISDSSSLELALHEVSGCFLTASAAFVLRLSQWVFTMAAPQRKMSVQQTDEVKIPFVKEMILNSNSGFSCATHVKFVAVLFSRGQGPLCCLLFGRCAGFSMCCFQLRFQALPCCLV